MTRRQVEVEVVLRDSFSKGLGSIKSSLGSLATGAVAGITSAFTNKILDGVGNALAKVGEQFTKAVDMETINIRGGNDLLALGISKDFESGLSQYKSYAAILAKEARDLPGETKDYIQVFQGSLAGLVTSMQKQGKSYTDIDTQIKKFAKETVPNLSILQQADSTLQNKDLKAFSDAYLRGESLASLEGREMMAKASIFATKLREAEAQGLTGIDALNKALEGAVTLDMKLKLKDSFSGMVASTFESLFGIGGFFDISRDLNSILDGDQSVFTELKQTFELLFGEDGTFAKLSKIFGIQDNAALSGLYKGIEGFNIWLSKLNGLIGKFNGIDLSSIEDHFMDGISGLLSKIARGFMNSAPKSLNGLDDFIENILILLVVNPLNHLANTPQDTAKILGIIGSLVLNVVKGLFAALVKIDWKLWVTAAGVMAFNIFIMPAITAGVAALATIVGGFLATFGLPILAIGLLVAGAVLLVTQNWDKIKPYFIAFGAAFMEGIRSVTKFIVNAWNKIKSTSSNAINNVSNAITSFFSWLSNAINTLKNKATFWVNEEANSGASTNGASSAPVSNSNRVSSKNTNIGSVNVSVTHPNSTTADFGRAYQQAIMGVA